MWCSSSESESSEEIFCDICKEYLDCEDNGAVSLNEWMEISSSCCKCFKTGCACCLIGCYSCVNTDDSTSSICNTCEEKANIFKQVGCSEHTWYVCKEHINDKCGECYANENYTAKYE